MVTAKQQQDEQALLTGCPERTALSKSAVTKHRHTNIIQMSSFPPQLPENPPRDRENAISAGSCTVYLATRVARSNRI